jgi:hypothetical protein
MMNVRRVSLIAVVAAFVLSLGPPVSGNAADLPVVRVGKSQAIGVPFMPLMIGDVAGIWEQVGITYRRCAGTARCNRRSRPVTSTWRSARGRDWVS